MTANYFDQTELWGRPPEPYQVQVLADILDLMPADVERVLDVGCGDGAITNALPNRLHVVGLDPSPAALQHVRRETRIGNIADIPFADDSFDLVLTTDVIEHLPPDVLARAVRELTRVARKYVLVCVPHREDWQANFTRCADCGLAYHINHHQRSWSEPDLAHGLLPAPWAAQEIRYSGLLRPYYDPTTTLRRQLGLWHPWEGAICPQCGSKEQAVSDPRHAKVGRLIDGLCASLWWSDGVPCSRFNDRSEIMALYRRGQPAPRRTLPAAPAVVHDNFYHIDFANPHQWTEGWIVDPRWPSCMGGAGQVRCGHGVRLLDRIVEPNEVALRFPVLPAAGDVLELTLTAEGREATVAVHAVDALNDRRIEAEVLRVGSGPQRLRFSLDRALHHCRVDRYGYLLVVGVRGAALLERADYRPAGRSVDDTPWMQLTPGHHVVARNTPGYVRSWGYTSLAGGRLPLPLDADRPEPMPAAATLPDLTDALRQRVGRLGQKHANCLLFLLDQELAKLSRAAGKPYPDVPRSDVPRQRRLLVLSHLYPSPMLPNQGPFVHEQVSALRVAAGLDARVVCCTPHWINSLHPLKIVRAYERYREAFDHLAWDTYDGVPVLYLPYLVGGCFRPWLHAHTYTRALLRASGWLRASFDFGLIHAHTSLLDGSAVRALGAKYDVPYVITEHTGPFRLLTDHWLKRRHTVRALTGARDVLCVSDALAEDVRAVLPAARQSRVRVLHNGVDTDLFYPPWRWEPSAGRPRLLSVISLDANKNPLLLLDAFARLLDDVPGATLAIAGQGPLHGELARRIRHDGLGHAVTLLGPQKRSEVARLMRDECDLFVLPSNSETFGVVLIEALASGKPVVATDCGGPRDIVTDASLGLLCPPGDAAAIHHALRAAVESLPQYDPAAIRRHAAAHYDYPTLAARLDAGYAAVSLTVQ